MGIAEADDCGEEGDPEARENASAMANISADGHGKRAQYRAESRAGHQPPETGFVQPKLHLRKVRNESDEREPKEAGEGRHPYQHVHLPVGPEISEAAVETLPHALVAVEIFFGVLNAKQRPD